MTLWEKLQEKVGNGIVWDYHIYTPLSMDDEATVKVVVDVTSTERKIFTFDLVLREE